MILRDPNSFQSSVDPSGCIMGSWGGFEPRGFLKWKDSVLRIKLHSIILIKLSFAISVKKHNQACKSLLNPLQLHSFVWIYDAAPRSSQHTYNKHRIKAGNSIEYSQLIYLSILWCFMYLPHYVTVKCRAEMLARCWWLFMTWSKLQPGTEAVKPPEAEDIWVVMDARSRSA